MTQVTGVFRTWILVLLMSGSLALPAVAQTSERIQRGQQLVAKNCARCHAIARTGNGAHPQAPAFRTLGSRYPIDSLAEGLVEGFSSGHPDMPEFMFALEDATAIIAYIKSIQH